MPQVKTPVWNYSYLEIDGAMIKKPIVFNGLHGRLMQNLGKQITLYMNGSYVVAFSDANGKTFSAEKLPIVTTFLLWALMLFGCLSIIVIIGIPIVFYVGKKLYLSNKVDSGANLLNAIQIPMT